MPDYYEEPTTKSVTSLLGMLFGDDLAANDSDAQEIAKPYVATFINSEDKIVATCACDLPFVAYSGAAFSMVPADVAKEMIDDGELTETFLGNFHELMNICSKLMLSDDSLHLKLDKTLQPDQGAAEAIAAVESPKICAFTLDIPGYGSGEMVYHIAA
ncbi:MAG: hypothetical protein AAF542_16820 [Pseudomonadota bacterium]